MLARKAEAVIEETRRMKGEGRQASRRPTAHGLLESVLPQYSPMAPTRVREPFYHEGWVYGERSTGWRV